MEPSSSIAKSEGDPNDIKRQNVTFGSDPLSMQKTNMMIQQVQLSQAIPTMNQGTRDQSFYVKAQDFGKSVSIHDSYFEQKMRQRQLDQKLVKPEIPIDHGEIILYQMPIKETLKGTDGKFFITNYKVCYKVSLTLQIFYKDGTNPADELTDPCLIPYGYFQRVKFSSDKKSNWMELTTKDQRQFKFKFDSADDYHKAITSMTPFMYLKRYKTLFAFKHATASRKEDPSIMEIGEEDVVKGVMNDFHRMQIDKNRFVTRVDWEIKYRMRNKIDLPQRCYIPTNLLEEQILGAKDARVDGRVPILAYYNHDLNISIWRSSELQTQIMNKRSLDDQNYLAYLNPRGQETSHLFIMSPYDKEVKNCPEEHPQIYQGTKVVRYNFYLLGKVQTAFEKMWKISNHYDKSKKKTKFLSKIQKCEWLVLLDTLITKAIFVHKAFTTLNKYHMKSTSILIYCQNGQAGSCILSSLAQIIIDPYYRTIEGLKHLILKEWVYFGHNFIKFNGLMSDPQASQQDPMYAPIFILFLDCVHQLIEINPTSFEYTSDYLVLLGYHCFTGKYMEFTHVNPIQNYHYQQLEPIQTYDQPNTAEQANATQKLVSFFARRVKSKHLNKLYEADSFGECRGLFYQTSLLRYWTGYFGRYSQLISAQHFSGIREQGKMYRSLKEDNHQLAFILKQNLNKIRQLQMEAEEGKEGLNEQDLAIVADLEGYLDQLKLLA